MSTFFDGRIAFTSSEDDHALFVCMADGWSAFEAAPSSGTGAEEIFLELVIRIYFKKQSKLIFVWKVNKNKLIAYPKTPDVTLDVIKLPGRHPKSSIGTHPLRNVSVRFTGPPSTGVSGRSVKSADTSCVSVSTTLLV